ncbi:MAG: RNA polymerase sigma factor [Pseudomonadales bacterium]
MVSDSDEKTADQDLIRRVLAGDDGAFQRLIERYQNLIWSLLNRMISDRDDREELAQDIFLKVYFKLNQFRFESKFSTWLYTIAYRAALSHLRKVAPEMTSIEQQAEVVSEDGELDSRLDAEQVVLAMNQLGLEDRTMLTLYHLHNCTIKEISTIVGKPDGTVKNQLFRARQKLKGILQAEVLV